MPSVKRFTNLKVGTTIGNGVVGPQNLASGTYLTALIPCRGAAMIQFTLKSTDTNVPSGTVGLRAANLATGVSLLDPTSLGLQAVILAGRMDQGGIVASITGGPFPHNFLCLQFTAHASGHTAFTIDADVFYQTGGDADVIRAELGQSTVVPV